MKEFNEPSEIKNDDWRFNAISTLVEDWKSPWTGILHLKGAKVLQTDYV